MNFLASILERIISDYTARKNDKSLAEIDALADRYFTDPGTRKPAHYLRVYDSFLAAIRNQSLSLLELGVSTGQSLLAWREYFPGATIVGMDIREMPDSIAEQVANGSLHFIQGDQSNPEDLRRCLDAAGSKFDIIIDDASHLGWLSKASFEFLFPEALLPGGLYFIEDYGAPYSETFYDGGKYQRPPFAPDDRTFPSHAYGMVGWVKQLIDEIHNGAIDPEREDRFNIDSLHMWHSIAVVRKGGRHPFIPQR